MFFFKFTLGLTVSLVRKPKLVRTSSGISKLEQLKFLFQIYSLILGRKLNQNVFNKYICESHTLC